MSKHIVSETMRADAYIPVCKALLREIGLHNAIFICDLITKEAYFRKRGTLQDDGYFFNTEVNRLWDTGLSPKQQRKCVKSLEEMEVIKQKRQGNPAKQFFLINTDKIEEIIKTHVEKKMTYNTQKNNNKLCQKDQLEKSVVPKRPTRCAKKTNSLINKNKEIIIKNVCSTIFSFDFYTNKKTFLGKILDAICLEHFSAAASPVSILDFLNLVKKAIDITQVHVTLPYTDKEVKDWFEVIKVLLIAHKVSLPRIHEVLDEFAVIKPVNKKWMPDIDKAVDFMDKFNRIVKAIDRHREKHSKQDSGRKKAEKRENPNIIPTQ